MGVPWLFLAPAFGQQSVYRIDQDLVVKADRVSFDPVAKIGRFRQGVQAIYGPTTVTADELEIHQADRFAIARGNVRMVDPDGTLTAKNLQFSWDPQNRTGQADDIVLDFAGVLVKAAHADLKPELWTLTDVYGSSCRRNPPLFDVRTPKVTFIPGRKGWVSRPRIDILGRHLLTLPTQRFNLDPRVQGLRPPNVSYRKGDGFGMNWESGVLLSEQSALTASLFTYPRTRPSYSLQVSRSFVPAEKSRALISPRSDLAERFGYSYFENIELPTPQADQDSIRATRDTLSAGTYWFQGSANDTSGAEYSKPIEVAYEKGGGFGGLGANGQLRVQTIRKDLGPYVTRLVALGAATPRPIDVMPGVQGHVRVDGAAFLGGSSSGWLRGMVGATYQPIRPLTVSLAIHQSLVAGTSQFPVDELVSTSGGTARFDVNGGPTQASIMWRYDRQKGWFDRQYYVSQVVGCIEPYMLYRQYYGDYRIGLNLRLGNFLEVVTRRQYERGLANRHVIDGPGRKQ